MSRYTLTEGDILYLTFYLKDKDPISGSVVPHNLSSAESINFYMRKYGANANAISTNCEIVSATLGICRTLVTVPVYGNYYSEIEVTEAEEKITFGPIYFVVRKGLS